MYREINDINRQQDGAASGKIKCELYYIQI